MFPGKILLVGRLNKRPASNKRPPLPTLPPPSHNHHKKKKKKKKTKVGILHCPIGISSYDLFADVTLWDVYEASPESALKDIMHNEVEIDNVECY